MKTYQRILSIAGSDSGGGAGIQADIKTISACGAFAMTAITAVTVQNTEGVRAVHVIPAETIREQITAVLEDIGADAVKLGMMPTTESVHAIADVLERFEVEYIVLDPVMISTSGHRLISPKAVEAIRERLFPLATVITPNIPETEFLTGLTIGSEADFPKAADVLLEMGAQAVVLKAGHLKAKKQNDWLFTATKKTAYPYDRIETPNTHGTGCTLSSAIATYLAKGHLLDKAVEEAESYIHEALEQGKNYRIGHGSGPVHHFFRWWM